jgi:lysophospholipase L1-like esterase
MRLPLDIASEGFACMLLLQIDPELMPDALHPNAAGMELFAQCLSPLVDDLMANASKGNQQRFWGR